MYGGNISVSIQGIELERFSAFQHTGPFLSSGNFPRYAVFNYFFSYEIKQYASTKATHSKHIIEILQNI